MNDKYFSNVYRPLRIPATFNLHGELNEQILYVLGQLNEATAYQVITALTALLKIKPDKITIAAVQSSLTDWYNKGLLGGTELDGNLHYNLRKITEGHVGSVR